MTMHDSATYPDIRSGRGLGLLHLVLCIHVYEYLAHVGLQHHPSHADLLQDVMYLVHVEDHVQLTDVLKAAVKGLHKYLKHIHTHKRGKVPHTIPHACAHTQRKGLTQPYHTHARTHRGKVPHTIPHACAHTQRKGPTQPYHTHARAHTHTEERSHTPYHTHARTHRGKVPHNHTTRMRAHTHTQRKGPTQPYHTHARTHRGKVPHTIPHACTHTYRGKVPHTIPHACAHTQRKGPTHHTTRMRAHTEERSHTPYHTHAHAHTHTEERSHTTIPHACARTHTHRGKVPHTIPDTPTQSKRCHISDSLCTTYMDTQKN